MMTDITADAKKWLAWSEKEFAVMFDPNVDGVKSYRFTFENQDAAPNINDLPVFKVLNSLNRKIAGRSLAVKKIEVTNLVDNGGILERQMIIHYKVIG